MTNTYLNCKVTVNREKYKINNHYFSKGFASNEYFNEYHLFLSKRIKGA